MKKTVKFPKQIIYLVFKREEYENPEFVCACNTRVIAESYVKSEYWYFIKEVELQ